MDNTKVIQEQHEKLTGLVLNGDIDYLISEVYRLRNLVKMSYEEGHGDALYNNGWWEQSKSIKLIIT